MENITPELAFEKLSPRFYLIEKDFDVEEAKLARECLASIKMACDTHDELFGCLKIVEKWRENDNGGRTAEDIRAYVRHILAKSSGQKSLGDLL